MVDDIIWTATDPQGRQVILKKSTLEFHIAGADHSPTDSAFRRSIVKQAEQTGNKKGN